MESNCTVMTLKDGEFKLPFGNSDRLANDIEERTGILAIDQIYMSSGKVIDKKSLGRASINDLQVVKLQNNSARYFITIETGTVKVYLEHYRYRIINDLFIEFTKVCKKHNLNYPINEYALYFKRQILPLSTSMSKIPPDSQIILVKDNIYSSQLTNFEEIITIILVDINGCKRLISVNPNIKIRYFQKLISNITGSNIPTISVGDQIYTLRELENHLIKTIIMNDDKVEAMTNFSGGGGGVYCPGYFSFNSMNNAVHIEFSKNAPKWRLVKIGVSWQGICVNPRCKAANQKVICNCGLGVFDVDNQILKTKCPMCKKNVIEVSGCGFYSCEYEFYGTLKNGKKLEGKGNAGINNYTSFLDGEKLEWVFMRIQVTSSDLKSYY